MKLGLDRYRVTVLVGICLLIVLLMVMVTNLLSQLRELSRAAEDNMQWSISQIDTEFANLDATLTEQIASQSYTDQDIQLRVDIALSRLNIVTSGRTADIFAGDDEVAQLIVSINAFAERAISILDGPDPLTGASLIEVQQLVRDVRPQVRDISLLGVRLGAERSDARRAKFANQLTRTGGIAIALLILMGLLMVVLDQLLRRAARRDAALSASSRQLSATITASLDAIVTADAAGRIIDFNASAERVFGWTRAEIVGRTMEDTFIPYRMRKAHHNGMKRYLETGKPRVVDAGRVEMAALRKSGEEFPVELNITTTQTGESTTFIAYIRDISKRKINEQGLIDARDRAERTDRAKSKFLTVMSHEMRTPLNGILGVLDLLKTGPLDDTQARYAKIAVSSGEVLLELVNEALDITRIETGQLQLTCQTFALGNVMQRLIDVFDPLAREKGLSISLEIDPALRGFYHGDDGRIRQVLTNLLGNAIKFTKTGGVALQVSGIHGPEKTSLRFEVIDTGIGIPTEQQENIFEDFFAFASGEGRQARGDGLGLSISRRIARAMDGDVALKNSEGSGSVFLFTLPLQRAVQPTTETSRATVDAAMASPSRILIVEDNAINRSVLSDMLRNMGHSVDEAVNGAEGVEKANAAPFDIIFMDISMPVTDGIDATRQLRKGDGPNAKTCIVGLTAHGREEFREGAVAAGMDRFHTKPVRLDTLRGLITEVTSRGMSKLDDTHFSETLIEMIDVLGPDKVAEKTDVFLSELAAFCADLRVADDIPDTEALAQAAHKVKGAASLFGQVALQDTLADVERDARASTLSGLQTWADSLESHAVRSKSVFEQVLNRSTSDP